MTPGTRLLLDIAYDATLIFLALGTFLALLYGLALIFRLSWSLELNEKLNRWISTRQAMRPMELSRDIHRPLYRKHRSVGLLVTAGAAVVLYVLLTRYHPAPIIAYFSRYMRPGVASWLLDWFRGFVLVTNVFALLIGLALFLRPSLLKGLEAWANRSYSGRGLSKFLDVMHLGVDRAVTGYPRLFGTAIVIGSLYALGSFAMLLVVGSR